MHCWGFLISLVDEILLCQLLNEHGRYVECHMIFEPTLTLVEVDVLIELKLANR